MKNVKILGLLTLLTLSSLGFSIEGGGGGGDHAAKGNALANEQLKVAVGKLDIRKIQAALAAGADVNKVIHFEFGKGTPLQIAVTNRRTEIVRLLLENGADVKSNSHYLLTFAVEDKNIEILKLLLERGAEVNTVFSSRYVRRTVLRSAYERYVGSRGLFQTQYYEMIKILLKHGAKVDATANIIGCTILHDASFAGATKVVRLLLKTAFDINVRGAHGNTALHGAAYNGHADCVSLLLERGANVNAVNDRRLTALHSATGSGHETCVRLLLERGADIHAITRRGKTALDFATEDRQAAACVSVLRRWPLPVAQARQRTDAAAEKRKAAAAEGGAAEGGAAEGGAAEGGAAA